MLFQPTNIAPDDVNGSGCVDADENLEISWQVNGDSAMIAYSIVISKNSLTSQWSYSTGKIVLDDPFWGRDYSGNVQRFSVELEPTEIDPEGTEYIKGIDLENGENRLTVKVFNKNNVSQISRVKITKE